MVSPTDASFPFLLPYAASVYNTGECHAPAAGGFLCCIQWPFVTRDTVLLSPQWTVITLEASLFLIHSLHLNLFLYLAYFSEDL